MTVPGTQGESEIIGYWVTDDMRPEKLPQKNYFGKKKLFSLPYSKINFISWFYDKQMIFGCSLWNIFICALQMILIIITNIK